MISRKGFLSLLGALPLAETALGRALGKPNAVIGVLSDIHVKGEKSAEDFRKVLEWYRSRDVDGIVIPGDLADYGQDYELKLVADMWKAVFPDNRGKDGKLVVPVMIGGNHEFSGEVWQRKLARDKTKRDPAKLAKLWETTWKKDPEGVWKKCFGTDFNRIGIADIKGYKFVYCTFSFEKDVDAFIEAHADELKAGKPFFYLQHCRIKGSCYAGLRDASDARVSDASPVYGRRPSLEKRPWAIALTGDLHWPHTDDRHLLQNKFTTVNCPSFRYTGYSGGQVVENAHGGWKSVKGPRKAQMPCIDLDFDNKQGMVFFLYDRQIVIERWDLFHYERAAPDWVLPLEEDGRVEWKFTREKMPANYAAPRWPEGAKVTVSEPKPGVNRAKEPTEQIAVSWPSARNDEHARRVMFYRIEARDAAGRTILVKRTLPTNFARSLERQTGTQTCLFAVDELGGREKAAQVKFSVVGEGTYGHESEPIN